MKKFYVVKSESEEVLLIITRLEVRLQLIIDRDKENNYDVDKDVNQLTYGTVGF